MFIQQYIDRINTRFKTGISREHSYRGDLQNLLEALCQDILVTNEPARVACGAPDYILTKRNIPVGYIEAKDVGEDLDHKKHNEQFERYKASLANLIITDYIHFRLYREGELVTSISIAEIDGNQIKGVPGKYQEFEHLINEFSTHVGQTIKSPKKLAGMMAGKARLLANVIENALLADEKEETSSVHQSANITLRDQMSAFKDVLIHDIEPKEFADIYAQTIAYGMFSARLHDPTLEDFSRQEASELIPKSNPFLRKLFQYVAGYDLDDRLKWIVDALADIFRATDVASLLKNFGSATQQNDPIIHFYETFIGEYDPKLKKSRGVWYTPEPVVNFIVRAVDDILKLEFGLKDGLADTSKTKIKVKVPTHDSRFKGGMREVEREVHKVQILDPATGTGTFLAEIIKHIYNRFQGQQGIWSNYVENHLIPRLHGFEILMASYAMAHLKLDLLLAETKYRPTRDQRFRVYLTNSLEEFHPDTGTLFASWLSAEANEANHIKRDTPVMIVIGNPPYSVSSSNKGAWIEKLIEDYKQNLDETNINSLSDDYVKFIRYGQYLIEKNGSGILAFITNNSFIDGLVHRQMRKNILESFDKVYILDLHGSSIKKERAPDGGSDENVFDIMPGVSINIFIKTPGLSKQPNSGSVYHYDLYGKRKFKYETLFRTSIKNTPFEIMNLTTDYYFFVPKDFSLSEEYEKGFMVTELFKIYGSGVKFRKDNLLVKKLFKASDVKTMLDDVQSLTNEQLKHKYSLKETKDWKINDKRQYFANFDQNVVRRVHYRAFDYRYTYYPLDEIHNIIPRGDSRKNLMINFFNSNVGLCLIRNNRDSSQSTYFVTNEITSKDVISSLDSTSVFPLYIYPEGNGESIFNDKGRKPNFDEKIIERISKSLDLDFEIEKSDNTAQFAPIDILDYIYAILYLPSYRQKFREFVKINYPRIPYPDNVKTFWEYVRLGKELREIHLLESSIMHDYITSYPKDGDNIITRKMTKASIGFELTDDIAQNGRVWINDDQYFDGVPLKVWDFYIGGYQPAQKWLKDRHGRELSYEEILHYQKIVVALMETDRIMHEIDKVEVL